MSRFGKKSIETVSDIELNVMPFIDIFSLLCTFLLFSAVFISIGIHTVQIPFFTNAISEEEKDKDKKPERELSVVIAMDNSSIELKTLFNLDPVDEQKTNYKLDQDGLEKLHLKLLEIKKANAKADKVTLYTEDDVVYDNLIKVLDKVRLRLKDDPEEFRTNEKHDLFPKVILGSVIL